MAGHYTYEQRIVCFIDILGFSSRIKQTEKDTVEASQLLYDTCDALDLLNTYQQIMRYKTDIENIKVTQFSDSIVITFPWNEKDDSLYRGLKAIRYIQASLLKLYGVLLRGGIVLGNVIHTDKLLLGPAMVSAYQLESKCAVSPRIVVDPKVAYRFSKVKKRLLDEKSLPSKFVIHKDFDDTSYIDYFNFEQNEIFNDDELLDYFKQLCEMISKNVDSSDISIRMKYLWMRNKIKKSNLYKKPDYTAAYKQIVTNKNKGNKK